MSDRRLGVFAAVVLLATLALAGLGDPADHAGPAWRSLPAFDFVYGLLGCIAIVLISKALGALALQKPEGWDAPRDEDAS